MNKNPLIHEHNKELGSDAAGHYKRDVFVAAGGIKKIINVMDIYKVDIWIYIHRVTHTHIHARTCTQAHTLR